MRKNFLFPNSKCSSSRFVPGLLGGFLRSGFAAFGILEAGCTAPPPATSAARQVRAISSVDHIRELGKPELAASLRSAARAYWLFGQICIREKKIFTLLHLH